MKLHLPCSDRTCESSLPVRGAWIEIPLMPSSVTCTRGRSPCGERGLKCYPAGRQSASALSLPVRGAWIEIPLMPSSVTCTRGRSPCGERGLKCYPAGRQSASALSLPVRGAWIEITLDSVSMSMLRRSPCGERGLKFHLLCDVERVQQVAPRAGSVD